MKKNLFSFLTLAGLSVAVYSCSKDDTSNVPVIPPSNGDTAYVLNGLIGTEDGSQAGNSVFADLSTPAQTAVARTKWDLGFYCGTDFRIIINNTTGATAAALAKTDLTQVTAADTAGFKAKLAVGQGAGNFSIIDNVDGKIDSTVIAAVSATDASNLVYIVNPSNSLNAAGKDWYKIRIIRNGSNGYQLQYAKLSETTVKTITVTKDANYNFKYVSFDTNAEVAVEPAKAAWDIEWTLTTYKASAALPYMYADFIYINSLAGVTAAELIYKDSASLTPAEVRNLAYTNYSTSNVAATKFSSVKTVIGSNWRTTSGGAVAVKSDRFYVIKDAAGNVYKLKFISFASTDGGTRGKPKFQFTLVK